MASSITSSGYIASKLFYEQEGNKDGPKILFIHGLGGTTNAYQPLVSSLQEYNLIRFDFSGHGRSQLPSGKTSIASYVEDCEAIIKHLGLNDISVVAHSMGCLIAMHLAAKRPKMIKNLIFFGPVKSPLQAGQDGLKLRAKTCREAGMVAVADTVLRGSLPPSAHESRPELVGFTRELLSRQSAEGYALACEALAGSQDPEWGNMKAKVKIVSGKEDKVSAPAVCEAVRENLAKGGVNVDVVSWDGVGHWLMLEDVSGAVRVVKEGVGR